MSILEKVWILVSISIIFIILSTDPKTSISGSWGNQLSTVFASASDGQKFIKQLNWILITVFFLITVILSYLA
jgi:protein translocase SecG subunit